MPIETIRARRASWLEAAMEDARKGRIAKAAEAFKAVLAKYGVSSIVSKKLHFSNLIPH
jgi:hypothetical protein